MGGFIGIFWYITTEKKFIVEKFDLNDEIHKSGLFLTSSISHTTEWDKYKNYYSNVPFTHFPRGRVNYEVPKNKFQLDMDACLHDPTLIKQLCKIFLIDDKKVTIVPQAQTNKNSPNYGKEGTYTCHQCKKK
jgi:hypothetical protein